MAHHKSAKKRIIQSEKRRQINKTKVSKVRTMIKKLRDAINTKKKDEAVTLLKEVQSALAKLAKGPTMKDRTASRKTSRLASAVAKI